MHHYMYLLKFSNGKLYVGARSCNPNPEDDVLYLGSGSHLPKRDIHSCEKKILATYSSRSLLMEAERDYIVQHGCVASETYYNVRHATYDRHGTKSKHTVTSAVLDSREGANTKRRMYTGSSRTRAQLADDKAKRGKKTGPCPAKGKSGGNNNSFIPWFFIDTEKQVTVITNITKKQYASKLGLTSRQMTHRFHKTNINKPVKQGVCKGYVFGNVEDLQRVLSNEQD